MSNTSNNKTANSKPTKSKDKDKLRVIVGEIGRDSKTGILGRGYSSDNGKTFHVTDTMYGRLYDPNDIEGIWNGGTADKVKKEVDSATAEIPAAVSAANSAVQYAESAVAASKVNSDAIVAQSEAISEAKSAMDSATAEIQQTAANAASDAAKIRADVAKVQNEVDTAKAANSASVEALKSDVSAAKQDLSDVHDSLDKAQSAIEQNQKLINDSVAKITSDVSATKQDLADVHDSLTKAQAAAEQNQKAIDKSIAQINDSVDATNQDLAGVRKDLAKAQSDIAANQKSINDNVAKINADITQDRKDIASAQQANTDTAKQLDTYSKQAVEQGKTIKTIQDKQDGFTATLADVQGNVTQVSDKVDGLSASLKDAQDNVASVKAQADQLSATLTDHVNSIATLTASAKELSSTLEDADGRLSKVEQTAQTNSSTLSDLQGDLSQVKQGATTLTATLKDAQGNISTLQQKADSVSTQLASAQGDIATLQTGVDGVKATLASHDKTIHTLQLDSKSLKDSMADAQGDISTLQKSATSLDSEMKDHAGRLSKVEQSAATQATTLSDLQGNLTQVKQQADGLVTTLKSAQGDITQIQQKADGTLAQLKSAQGDIASLQTDVTGIKATLTSHEGDIHTLQADSKTLKDDMQDAQGNISSLQKTATSLNSEISSQDGRLSKVEQTAKEHTSTISDLGKKVDSNGGGVNLLTNSQGPFRPTQKNYSATVSDNYDVYNSDVYMVQGQTYTVSGQTNGTWSGTHNTEHVSDNCVLWLTDNSNVSQIISADTMPHTFTWPYPTKSYHLRVNAYHHGADNPIYAEKVKIERGSVATPYSPAPEDLATVTQVKQTADGIETTLKSAQGDIDQIKQTAKGTSEQLADVKGNVTNIQKDVSGLKQTTADNAGNIHTLQLDSKTLKDDMADAKGNISSLQKTSTSLVSEFKDHDGRISKTEQTASTLVNEFADQQGHLNRVEQTAQGTQQTVANQQGQINTIKTDASGIHETLTGQGNQIANINVTLNGLSSKYEGVSGDLGKLSDKVTTNSTQITQNKKEIDLKADQSTVDNLTGEVSQNKAQLKVQAGQISSKVSSTDFKTLNDKVGNLQAGSQNMVADGDASAYGATVWENTAFRTHQFYYNSTKNMFVIDTTSKTEVTAGCPNWFPVKAGQQYTLYFNGFMSNNVSSYNVWLLGKQADAQGSYTDNYQIITGERLDPSHNCIVTRTFTVPSSWTNYVAYIRFGNNGSTDGKSAVLFFNEVSVKEGNINTGYSPALEDSITLIKKNSTAIDQTNQKISLKADQAEVNKVKNTASQNSSRLNVMAGEISSKVTSTDVNNIVDSKGYATTSTVQSLITQKAGTINEGIVKLDQTVKQGAENNVQLVRKSDFEDGDKGGWTAQQVTSATNPAPPAELGQSGMNVLQTNTHDAYEDGIWYSVKPGEKFDVDFWCAPSPVYASSLGLEFVDKDKKNPSWQGVSTKLHGPWEHITGTIAAPANASFAMPWFSMDKPADNTGNTAWLAKPSIRRQDATTVAAIQQITASIDGIQSTVANKADKSQITQLSNAVQSKVSTADFNSKITQLSNDINLRVTKGELLGQINIQAGNTLIQNGRIYLDANSIVFGKNSRAIIPSAAIGNLDAAKITTGSISVPMSDGKDNSISFEDNGVVIKSKGKSSDFYDANEGTSKLKITGAGVEFISSTDNDESIKRLGIMTPTTYQNVNTSGMTFVVTGVGDSSSGTLNDRGAFFSLARKTLSYPLDYKGMIYATGEMGDLDTGFHFNDPVYIHPYGAETGIRSTWCSWSSMGNRKFPVLVNSDHGWSGIAFPMWGQAFVFSNNGYVARPNQKVDSYSGYGEGNRDYFDSTDPNQKH